MTEEKKETKIKEEIVEETVETKPEISEEIKEEVLDKDTARVIKKCIEKTKNNNKYFLTFLLAYNGTDEMLDCISNMKKYNVKVTPENIKKNLWTKNLPAVDLIIRTGTENDPHNSAGFMMWNTAYSQLHFTKTLFPAFRPKELEKIIDQFNERNRRYGK